MRGSRRAFSVLEIALGLGLFSLLGLLLLTAFRSTSRAMVVGQTRATLLQETNIACARLSREVERGLYDSLSLGGSCCSLLSALDQQGTFQYQVATGVPRWQNFLVFYLDASTSRLRLRTVPVAGTPTETAPCRLEQFPPMQAITTYCNAGQNIARQIYALDFQVSGRQLVTSIGAQLYRPDRTTPDRVIQTTVSNFRN